MPASSRRLAAVITTAVTPLLVLAPTATAHPALPVSTPPVTNLGAEPVSPRHEPTQVGTSRRIIVQLGGTYTCSQVYDGTNQEYTRTRITIPTGTYEMHEMLRDTYRDDGQPVRQHSSWLDPAPDPQDPTSGVIITDHPVPLVATTPPWGSVLTPEPE